MERKVTAALRGEAFAKIECFTGNTSMYLYGMVEYYGLDSTYSSLFPDIDDINLEESFSSVPNEKRSQFACCTETLLDEEAMQTLINLF
jgi:hypothetical protein